LAVVFFLQFSGVRIGSKHPKIGLAFIVDNKVFQKFRQLGGENGQFWHNKALNE
jgi:hypothetical protein